ncbi:phosphoesterase [Phialemonium atrogriseum]|uniref:Phosphoesterase n=1 Tax=Phialemonium atrogriseum TaxID=1093897 RepID=A0AAJ0FKU8_9PEZI|nr:phosphoesterase [Phialemonium atrogriseum]KAK1771986.1 phosphoesterase [Phialemonium atrogriseum]
MASSPIQPLSTIKLRGHRRRRIAQALLQLHRKFLSLPPPWPKSDPIRVICISDTHNKRPELPPGDLLIHAGDLTENGSFDEVQANLTWLSSQPHQYKVLVAGNHDVLLDEAFLSKYPERRYGQTRTKDDLDWGGVIYLEDSSITLKFAPHQPQTRQNGLRPKDRELTIFGSPWTPQYGVSAFQYRSDSQDHWAERFAAVGAKPDIVVTHGPPRLHLDARDFHRAGCPYLAGEVARVRPMLHVFGHIHASYGREDVVLDGVQRGYEEVVTGWAGWGTVVWMAVLMVGAVVRWLVCGMGEVGVTTFVNASFVGGRENEPRNAPIVVEL